MNISNFMKFMTDTVTIEPKTGQNAYGEPSYGTAVTYKARIVAGNFKVIDVLGRERIARHKIWLNTANQIDSESRVTLPATYNPQQPSILNSMSYPDQNGPTIPF